MDGVLRKWQQLSEQLLGVQGRDTLWGGRPDIVVERFDTASDGTEQLDHVFIGEVKYTRDKQYAASGLRELLEYMAYARHGRGSRNYVESPDDLLNSTTVSGLLFVDRIGTDVESPEDIRVVQYPETIDRVV